MCLFSLFLGHTWWHLGLTPGFVLEISRLVWEIIWNARGIKPRSALCKANTYLLCSIQPPLFKLMADGMAGEDGMALEDDHQKYPIIT